MFIFIIPSRVETPLKACSQDGETPCLLVNMKVALQVILKALLARKCWPILHVTFRSHCRAFSSCCCINTVSADMPELSNSKQPSKARLFFKPNANPSTPSPNQSS
jgi:hypothetical protein